MLRGQREAQAEAYPPSQAALTARRSTRLEWLVASRWPLAVWVAAGVHATVLSVRGLRDHIGFETGFDTAIVDQTAWLLANFSEPLTTVYSRPFLSGHFEPGLVLLVPLYWVGLDVSSLLVMQSVALALTAPALYALARAMGASEALAFLPALLWLLSPAVAAAGHPDFHLATLLPPLLVVSVLAALRDRLLLLAVTTVLALSLKEDVAAMYLVLGAILFMRGRRRVGGVLTVGSAIWAVVAVTTLKALGDSDDFFAARFAGDRGDSIGDAFGYMARHPIETVVDVVGHSGADVLFLLVSTAGLALLAPVWLLIGLPIALHNMLSAHWPQHTLGYHYHLPFTAACFIAAAVGASRLASARAATRLLVAGGVVLAVGVSTVGMVAELRDPSRVTREERDTFDEALDRIPADASIAASPLLLSHLSRRKELYSFPEPFVRLDWGGSLSDEELAERARRVRFVALTGNVRPAEYPGHLGPVVERLLERDFVVVDSSPVGELLILERRR